MDFTDFTTFLVRKIYILVFNIPLIFFHATNIECITHNLQSQSRLQCRRHYIENTQPDLQKNSGKKEMNTSVCL